MTLSAPRLSTIRRLYAVSRNQCAYPECRVPIFEYSTGSLLGELCHINAKATGGPRFDIRQSSEQRHGFDNLVLMCSIHHTKIDAPENLSTYTAERLREIKRNHEGQSPATDESLAIRRLNCYALSA